jgi:aerobic carbon-monoxide dehydrogenase medium subunit
LLPTMKNRLAQPANIIDLGKVAELKGIEQKGKTIVVGAMTTHADVANSPIVQAALPGLASLAGGIGDPHVRNRGTIGGSVANNDPSADYPAALMALGATIVTNKRKIAADDYFQGMFATALDEGEMITKVVFPVASKFAYAKFPNPASRYALVGVAVAKKGANVRVAVTGAGSNGVFRWADAEKALSAKFNAKSVDGLKAAAKGLNGDIHASPEYRAHLIGVMAKRAVAAATAK